jgi:hypothetical protein
MVEAATQLGSVAVGTERVRGWMLGNVAVGQLGNVAVGEDLLPDPGSKSSPGPEHTLDTPITAGTCRPSRFDS